MLGVAERNWLGDADDFLNDFVLVVFGFFALNVFVVGDYDFCAFFWVPLISMPSFEVDLFQ